MLISQSVDASALGALYTYTWSQALLKDEYVIITMICEILSVEALLCRSIVV